MGLLLTLIYLFTAYLSPQVVFGSLADFHVQIIIAVVTLFFSLFSAKGSDLLRLPQTYAIVGLSGAIFLSLVFNGWIGGGPIALMDFLPNAMVFFFVVLNCKSKRHLQFLIVVLAIAAFFTIYQGWHALQSEDFQSPYLISQTVGEANAIYRVRGLSFISDPNDLAQFLSALIPMLFLFWAKGRLIRNVAFVYLPIVLLIFGMFLTHSRGGMLALMVMGVVAGHRKVGSTLSLVGGAVLFVGLSAMGWSGGRDVSAASGADRMEAWSVGLGLVRQHPLFGVGFNRFTDFYEITAHNTIVVCAAELGLLGLFFWVLLVMPTVRDALEVSRDREAVSTVEASATTQRFPWLPAVAAQSAVLPATLSSSAKVHTENEVRRIGRLLLVSLGGFLTAGWFLSRAYTMTLFILAGMVAVTYRMAEADKAIAARLAVPRAMKFSAVTCVVLITLVYSILRVDHLLPH